MKFKAIIFDFDGLMFDTERVWQKVFFEANDVFQTSFTEEDRIKTIGKNELETRSVIRELNPNIDIDKYRGWIKEKVYKYFYEYGSVAKKGLYDLLNYIKENKLKTAIASGSQKDAILEILKKAQIDSKMFNEIASGDMKIPAKPKPDIYLHVCKKLKLKPSECIVLEDSYNGVKAGHSAGCFTIMIPDTMPVTDEMKVISDLILNDLNEVVEFLKNS